MRMQVWSLASLSGFGSDPALLWLWRRPVATALIRPLAWEPPHAAGTALEKTKNKVLLLEKEAEDLVENPSEPWHC